jgi:hypothetical protein
VLQEVGEVAKELGRPALEPFRDWPVVITQSCSGVEKVQDPLQGVVLANQDVDGAAGRVFMVPHRSNLRALRPAGAGPWPENQRLRAPPGSLSRSMA